MELRLRIEKNLSDICEQVELSEVLECLEQKGVVKADQREAIESKPLSAPQKTRMTIGDTLRQTEHREDRDAQVELIYRSLVSMLQVNGYHQLAERIVATTVSSDEVAEASGCKAEPDWTELQLAVYVGRTERVKQLLGTDRSAKTLSQRTANGFTPLTIALHRRHYDTVEIICLYYGCRELGSWFAQQRADRVDWRDANGSTALHHAVWLKDLRGIRMLLLNGIDVSVKNAAGYSALHQAVLDGHRDMVQLLLDTGASLTEPCEAGYQLVHLATLTKQRDLLEALLLRDPHQIEAVNAHGITPLHLSISVASPEIVELLLSHKADVNARTRNGFTPLHLAALEGLDDIVRLLLRHGADQTMQDDLYDDIPQQWAARYQRHSTVNLLNKVAAKQFRRSLHPSSDAKKNAFITEK